MYQGIGAATSSALKLSHRNVQQQTMCVWPPGDWVQKQTGYCGLGTSGVNVGAKEFLYDRAPLGWAAVSWTWLGWAGLGWTGLGRTRLTILAAALLTAKQCCLISFHS